MNNNQSEFWSQLKKLASLDDHVPVPQSTLDGAIAIFQAADFKPVRNTIFKLRPAFTGLVRRAQGGEKLFFELDHEHIVQLEKNKDDEGYHLSGFAHGFDEIPVVLYGQESVFETRIETGSFEFSSLPQGKYNMAFSYNGEEYWIKDLDLNE